MHCENATFHIFHICKFIYLRLKIFAVKTVSTMAVRFCRRRMMSKKNLQNSEFNKLFEYFVQISLEVHRVLNGIVIRTNIDLLKSHKRDGRRVGYGECY